jgi:hypothetical protein
MHAPALATAMKEQTAIEDRAPGLFQPDTLLPSQYFDRMRRRTEYAGERRLMIAVLEDAVDVYRKQHGAQDPRGRVLFEEAEAWIENTDPTWIFSFENICNVLDLNAEYIRRGLYALRHRPPRRGQTPVVRLEAGAEELRKASGD